MSQEGYADPVTNDRPGFHSITPVSELTELVFEPERSGQATKLSSSGCEEPDGVTHNTHIDPHEGPIGLGGSRKTPKDGDLELARSTTLTHPVPRRAPTPGSVSIASSDL